MESNEVEKIKGCFDDRLMADEVISAYLNKVLPDLRSIITGLTKYGLTDEDKRMFAMLYINNLKQYDKTTNKHLREILLSPEFHHRLSPNDIKNIACLYMFDNSVYDEVIKALAKRKSTSAEIYEKVEEHIVDKLVKDERVNGITPGEENAGIYAESLYVLTQNPSIFNYRSKQDLQDMIYFTLRDKEGILPDIMTDENVLKYRTIEDQFKLMEAYLRVPYVRAEEIITSKEALETLTTNQQIELVDKYGKKPNEMVYKSIMSGIHEMSKNKKKKMRANRRTALKNEDDLDLDEDL